MRIKIKNCSLYISIIVLLIAIVACKQEPSYKGDYNPDVVKSYSNKSSSVTTKMDSIEAVYSISKQKLREFYELSVLASTNNDSVVNDLLTEQLKGYFKGDKYSEIDSLLSYLKNTQTHYISLNNFEIIPNDSLKPDSVKSAKYSLNLFNKDKKLIENINKTSIFVLKQEPIQFKREFKFYLKKLNEKKDTIKSK